MRITFRSATTLSLLASGLALSGCASEAPAPQAASLAEGITVLEVGEGRLSVAFRQGEEVVLMEAVRGGIGAYPEEPNMPRFEVDARFANADGLAFYVRQGGDDLIEQGWGEALQRQSDERVEVGSNAHLFLLGDDIADALRTAVVEQVGEEVADAIDPELDALEESASDLSRTFAQAREFEREHIEHNGGALRMVDGTMGEVVYGTNGPEDSQRSFAANYYYVALHKECIFACAGDHSATRIYEWVGSWSTVVNFCNHGSCASGMSQSSYLPYSEALSDYHPAWTAQTCSTHYHWDSSDGGHNCHDDSRRQMMNFVYNRFPARNSYHCSDNTGTNRWKAPIANSSRNYGYNHPSYCAYNYSDDATSSCPSSYQGTGDGCDCGCRFPDGTMADADCVP